MEDFDSQSSVEDVSEWAEHIEDVIDELQRNYKIIQTEMSCIVEKLQVVNQRPKNYISKRVVLPKKTHHFKGNNENMRNYRNCCSNCRGIPGTKSGKGEILESFAENILGIANEQYINNMIQKSISNFEKTLIEKMEKNCTCHHLEIQRNITDLKIQQSIMEETVRDIAIQIQEIVTEMRDMKILVENKPVGNNNLVILSQKNQEVDEGSDSNLNSNSISSSSSCSCTCSCSDKSSSIDTCRCSICHVKNENTVNRTPIFEVLRDVFADDEDLVNSASCLEGVEQEKMTLIRQMFKDYVRSLTQGRVETVERSIGDVRNKCIKDGKIAESKLDDIKLLINDTLKNSSAMDEKVLKLEQRIQGVKDEVNNLQDNLMNLEKRTCDNLSSEEETTKERIGRLENELKNRSELIQSAIRELNEENISIRKRQEEESGILFGNELSKVITEKISSIKELMSYISEELFRNEEKLQRQIKRNTNLIEELKSGCIEFEKYSDENFMEIVNSLKSFRVQTTTTLISLFEMLSESDQGNDIENFQQKIQNDFSHQAGDLNGMLEVRPHFFQVPSDHSAINSNNTSLYSKVPPNAYFINK
ncbi:cytoskeletal protein [Cryptosporidium felis]|nr:cytoskeletal protein [Cryptosporidium felis]